MKRTIKCFLWLVFILCFIIVIDSLVIKRFFSFMMSCRPKVYLAIFIFSFYYVCLSVGMFVFNRIWPYLARTKLFSIVLKKKPMVLFYLVIAFVPVILAYCIYCILDAIGPVSPLCDDGILIAAVTMMVPSMISLIYGELKVEFKDEENIDKKGIKGFLCALALSMPYMIIIYVCLRFVENLFGINNLGTSFLLSMVVVLGFMFLMQLRLFMERY